MGEIADDLIDRMMDDGCFPSRAFMPRGCNRGHKRKDRKNPPVDSFDATTRAQEFPGKKTPAHLLQEYPEKTFDMGFFPTVKPKPPKPSVEPVVTPTDPDVWDFTDEDAPF